MGALAIALTTAIGLILPYILKLLVDAMLAGASLEKLVALGGIGLGVVIAQTLLGFARRIVLSRAIEREHVALRKTLLARALHSKLLDLKTLAAGHVSSIVELDSRGVLAIYESLLPSFVALATTLLGTGAVLFWMSPLLSLIILIPAPIVIIIARLFQKSIRARSAGIQQERSRLFSALHEAFTGIESVMVYRGEQEVAARVHERGELLREHAEALITQRAWLFPALNLALSLAMLLTLVGGGYMVTESLTTAGVVIAFYFYLARALQPIRGATELLYGWHRWKASQDRVAKFMSHTSPLPAPEQPLELPSGPQAIALRNITFSYKSAELVLDELSLEIPAGDWVAILGPSGAGKSTLGKLVPRLFDPTQGEVLFGGVPLTQLELEQLRDRIGYVGQEVFLFEGTLRENLLFGLRAEVDEARLARAIEIAQVQPIIDSRTLGLDAPLGQGSGTLSGGQKKRLALARALLRDPAILVIDQLASDLEASLNRKIFERLLAEYDGSILYLGHRIPDGCVIDATYWLENGKLAPTSS